MSDLRTIETKSIRDFIEQAGIDGYLKGRVLDYGCGKQPYRSLVESFGCEYVGWDREKFPGSVGETVTPEREFAHDLFYDHWDAVLCTQVLQYIPYYPYYDGIQEVLGNLQGALDHDEDPAKNGHLILTYPTNWPEVEADDLHRFTKAGMEELLTGSMFEIVRHDFRHGIQHEGVSFAMGYGVIARA